MSREELFNELDIILGNGCISDDIHTCEFDGNCQEHEKVKVMEIFETYTKQIRADVIEELEKHKNELCDLHDLMFDYFEKVDIFTEKTDMERLALKIVTDGMQIIGATIDKLEQLKEQK